MLKKVIKYSLGIIVICFVAYNAVYIKKLNEVKVTENKLFDAKAYAHNYLYKKLPVALNNTIQIDKLLAHIRTNAANAFKTYSHGQNIGDVGYFLVGGQGQIVNIDDNDVLVKSDNGLVIKLAIQYIFGNAVRDAPGLISMNEFNNTMDMNNISGEINKIIKNEIVPPFIVKAKKGDKVAYKGCIELNQSALKLQNIEVIPVFLKIEN